MKILSAILPVRSINKFNLTINSQKVFNENLKIVEKPIIANLKSFYRSAEEKLNDIYIERLQKRLPTQTVKYNLDKFEQLPDPIKNAIKPTDISKTGHIDQSHINNVWEAAKNAHKPGVHGICPRFSGHPEEGILDTFQADSILELDINDSLDLISDATGMADGLADGLVDNADVVSDIATDAASDLGEHGVSLLERLIDIFT